MGGCSSKHQVTHSLTRPSPPELNLPASRISGVTDEGEKRTPAMAEGGKQATGKEESLEHPLVTFECFIFL